MRFWEVLAGGAALGLLVVGTEILVGGAARRG